MEIPAAERRQIARRSMLFATGAVALAASVGAALLVVGETRVALGILAGHGLALACGLSWILGALATFDGPFSRFAKATLGLAPLRLAVVVLGVCGLVWFARTWVDPAALGLSFVATQLVLQVAQADCFMRLARAASPYKREPKPLRFLGAKLW